MLLCFEADNTAHTERAPAAAAKEVSPLSLSVADVTRYFKWVNIRKAVGPDGIPGRVLRAYAFQFLQTFSICPSLCLWFPHASLDPLQFAYCSNRSTDNAIALTLHTALSQLENKNTYVRMWFVDYSSAFKTIVPVTLIAELQTLGLNRSLCRWILDFLTGRSQVVRMGNNTSSPLVLNTGAPQGCVLSPLLYSMYTHDCTATHSSNVI